MYYLQSRYYDPTVGRFVNEDEFLNLESTLGNNIFAYCENDSNNYFDTDGIARNLIQHKYSPTEALKYAEEWWNKRNSNYYPYSSDCVNFVSQCLYAGKFAPMSGVGRNNGWHSYKTYKKILFWKRTVWDVSASWSTVKGMINWLVLSKNYVRHCINSKKELIENIKNDNIKAGIPAFISTRYNGVINHAVLIGRVTKCNAYFYGHTNNRNAKSDDYGLVEYFNDAPKNKEGTMVVFYIV